MGAPATPRAHRRDRGTGGRRWRFRAGGGDRGRAVVFVTTERVHICPYMPHHRGSKRAALRRSRPAYAVVSKDIDDIASYLGITEFMPATSAFNGSAVASKQATRGASDDRDHSVKPPVMNARRLTRRTRALFAIAERPGDFPQLELLDLAGCGAWQRGDQLQAFRPELLGDLAFGKIVLHRR